MKITELKKKNAGELAELLAEKREALTKFAFGMSGARTKNTKAGRNLHKDIARILTLSHEQKTK